MRQLENDELQGKEALEDWIQIKNSLTYRISKWADLNSKGCIHLWYDSAKTTQKAQLKTFEMMKAIAQSRGVDIKLKDIRSLVLNRETERSLHPGTNLFFRIDFLKAKIADHLMYSSEETARYCVVSDFDIEAMESAQIFDQRTLDCLDKAGYVFNKEGYSGFENSFFIFDRKHESLKKIHKENVIDKTLSKIKALSEGKEDRYDLSLQKKSIGAQFVFAQYSLHFFTTLSEYEYSKKRKPRKIVKSPNSQFDHGGSFKKSDYQRERFKFSQYSSVPYTKNGRNYIEHNNQFDKIEVLRFWDAEPLKPVESH